MTSLEKGIAVFGVITTIITGAVYVGSISGRLSSVESSISDINPSTVKAELSDMLSDAKYQLKELEGSIKNGSVGDVKYSVLNETKFRELNGDYWVLMDGRDITGSQLCQYTGVCTLPDARGVFIRGMNVNRSRDTGDPSGNRPVGNFQNDEFKSHSHSYVNAGVWARSWKGDDSGPKTAHKQQGDTSKRGGVETRPRNIALYTYIKIN